MPSVVPATASTTEFSEERTKEHALHLSERIGIRFASTKANLRARDYILNYLLPLKQYADEQRRLHGAAAAPLMEIELQNGTGGQIFEIMGIVLTNLYSEVPNIVVRLSDGTDESQRNAALVNAHFDTTVGTQGYADAAIPTATMMEMVSNLVHDRSQSFKHAVIFLFNGCEESLQMCSHAFSTQHPWAATCRFVLNMEGNGNDGTEIMFQVGSNELLEVYAHAAPYPHGAGIGADIFSSGVIGADTDYGKKWLLVKRERERERER
jgi:hypothetical protein